MSRTRRNRIEVTGDHAAEQAVVRGDEHPAGRGQQDRTAVSANAWVDHSYVDGVICEESVVDPEKE